MKHKRSVISLALATIMLVSLCTVVSTGVSAAPSNSRASVQATPDLVGSPIAAGTGPAACVLKGSTDMYVFVKGYDGALWYRIFSLNSYQWTGSWVSLGGQLGSSPCAVSREAGILDVFVAGTNGVVYDTAYFSGAWHAWYLVGGKVLPGTGPAASGWPGREDVFVAGTNGALYQKTWTGADGWSGWTNLGGKLTSSPAAISRYGYVIDVFVAGTNGVVYRKEFVLDTWNTFDSLGGKVAPDTGPAVSYWFTQSDERMDVFVEGTNGALYQTTWTAANGWTNWANLGGVLSASPTAATFTYDGGPDIPVFVRGTNGLIYKTEFYENAWHGWSAGISGPP